jgi:hypothetical protein
MSKPGPFVVTVRHKTGLWERYEFENKTDYAKEIIKMVKAMEKAKNRTDILYKIIGKAVLNCVGMTKTHRLGLPTVVISNLVEGDESGEELEVILKNRNGLVKEAWCAKYKGVHREDEDWEFPQKSIPFLYKRMRKVVFTTQNPAFDKKVLKDKDVEWAAYLQYDVQSDMGMFTYYSEANISDRDSDEARFKCEEDIRLEKERPTPKARVPKEPKEPKEPKKPKDRSEVPEETDAELTRAPKRARVDDLE